MTADFYLSLNAYREEVGKHISIIYNSEGNVDLESIII